MDGKRVEKILKQNKKNLQTIAKEFSKTRKWNWPELKFLSKYIKNNQKVLDLGCGNGRLYQLFQNKKIEYIGIDSSEELIKAAKLRFDKPKFIVADALDLGAQFQKNEFDIIFSIAFLHHIPSKKLRLKILKDCFLILKPNGFLIFTVWNLRQWKLIQRYRLYSLFLGQRNVFIPWKSGEEKIYRYYYVFTLREIKKLIKRAGFKIVKNQKDSLRGFNLITIAQKI